MTAKNKPVLCYVTDRAQLLGGRTLQEAISSAIAAGAGWVQIREKDLAAAELLKLVRAVLARCANTPVQVIVNDRLDVALAAGAHGVHLGGQSLPAGEVTRWLRPSALAGKFLAGVSCHAVDDVRNAERAGASYAILGPIFDTPSKVRFGPSLGIAALQEACRAVRIPVLAIGGVTRENIPQCVAAGAAGIAAIRMFQEQPPLG